MIEQHFCKINEKTVANELNYGWKVLYLPSGFTSGSIMWFDKSNSVNSQRFV